jgi:hypothetical protein
MRTFPCKFLGGTFQLRIVRAFVNSQGITIYEKAFLVGDISSYIHLISVVKL